MSKFLRPGTLVWLAAAATAFASFERPALGDKVKSAPTQAAQAPPVDVSAVRQRLAVATDGKGHYLVYVPFGGSSTPSFYGDGKAFHQQRVTGSSKIGDERWDFVFWEPRVTRRTDASLGFAGGKTTLRCADRRTELTILPPAGAAEILDKAAFRGPLWRTYAYALARDNAGRYFYIDREREPQDSKRFRLWSGQRGAMKPLKMLNVVSDSEGEIFSTKAGALRLVIGRKESLWIHGKAEDKLQLIEVEPNAQLIYTDLGVYTGARLGTPCDDL